MDNKSQTILRSKTNSLIDINNTKWKTNMTDSTITDVHPTFDNWMASFKFKKKGGLYKFCIFY